MSPRTADTSRPTKRPYSFLSGLLLICGSVVLCLFLMEGFLRIIGYKPLAADAYSDHDLGTNLPRNLNSREFFSEPGFSRYVNVRTNNMGFMEEQDTTAAPAAGVRRIVVLGDSQTACLCPSEESYPHQLGLILNRSSAAGAYEVLNAGVARWSPYQYYLWAKTRALAVKPGQLIVGIYVGNDLVDLTRHDDRPYLEIQPNGAVVHKPPIFVVARDPYASSWSDRSRVVALLWRTLGYNVFYQVSRAKLLFLNLTVLRRNPVDIVKYMLKVRHLTGIHLNMMTQSLHQYVWFHAFPETLAPAVVINKEVMRMFQQTCQENHIRLTYLIIPSKIQIEPEDMQEVLGKLTQYDPSLAPDKQIEFSNFFVDQIKQAATELQVELIDPRSEMIRSKTGTHLYYKEDMHLTPEGNRVLGGIIASYLKHDGPGAAVSRP